MIFGPTKPERKPFSMTTKRIEWMDAVGRNPMEYILAKKFSKTSYCRNCGAKLTWGGRGYNFDHFDNNPTNNKQENCYLACATCHQRATKIEKRPIKGILGTVIGYKTVKRLIGYKKAKRTAGYRGALKPKR